MNEEIHQLQTALLSGITPERLKETSAAIIAAFREKRHGVIEAYARMAGIGFKDGTSRAFSQLIHLYHPDKHASILRKVELSAGTGDVHSLRALVSIYLAPPPAEAFSSSEREEEYQEYGDDDFGYSEDWTYDSDGHEGKSSDDEQEDEEEDVDEENAREVNFTEAVNLHFYGNLDEAVTLSDMKSLDGELDLSDSGITSLRGAEHCPLLASLNLSGNAVRSLSSLSGCLLLETLYLSENRIESIAPLANLASLRELDLSFNRIEDISILLTLERLEYVNIMGNPLRDRSVPETLRARGVMVIE